MAMMYVSCAINPIHTNLYFFCPFSINSLFLVFFPLLESGFPPCLLSSTTTYPVSGLASTQTGRCCPGDSSTHDSLRAFLFKILIFNSLFAIPTSRATLLHRHFSEHVFSMANPYNLRLRRPGQHRYTDPDSDTEKETDTTAKEDAS